MQLRQNVGYGYLQGTFPSKTKRFENLGALSLSPRRHDSQPAANSSWLFSLTGPGGSLLTSGAGRRKQTRGPSGPAAVSDRFARTPREGTEIATASGRRNLALPPRRMEIIDIQPITHFRPCQTNHSISLNFLSINNFHSTARFMARVPYQKPYLRQDHA